MLPPVHPVACRNVPSAVATAPPRPQRVEPVDIEELAGAIDARPVVSAGQSAGFAPVTGVTLRAQHVLPGDLFAALPGTRVHGADFIGRALDAGAVAVLTDQAGIDRTGLTDHPAVRSGKVSVLLHPDPRGVLGRAAAIVYGDPSQQLSVLGVTGTSGKTTTTYLLESALRAAGCTTGLVGTVETRVAGERLDSAFTTPEAPDLQALLAVMVEQGVTHVPMEVSSHALAMGRVSGTRYAVGGFTNLSQDHLDFHRDLEDYFQAKALLFDGRAAREVVCTDTEWGQRLAAGGATTASTTGAADWTATEVRAFPTGEQTFTAGGPGGRELELRLRLPGPFNIANALLAAGMLDAAGIDEDAIARGLAEVDVPGRMERVALGQDFTAVVDYSHKPGAVAAVLDAARAQVDGDVIVVLGSGGDRDVAKRPLMGEAAIRRAQLLIVTDDNPRSEDPAGIREAVLAGARDVPADERGDVVEVGDRRSAIAEAVGRAGPGDIVVVAGKGHETGQEVAGVVHPFSDREELAAALRRRLGEPRQTGVRRGQGDEEAS
ncbi:UDP-N-acetylmuramoyl-L-alanyl-D-glutamate--2,6-diaminopimelate ligase [Saccharopolyspora sp. HNM0983]|uniref:UDP-N-acetylmuramoyl-L-alanyl-D-glutamate--2,6-diaminopimelate ligase n=1 Tax=Saccharopolyspora montiporae TaxID=2781240 RepID=A0A929BAY9_9PSEU|nr:UDP-N-acetylmuramoyl-L-alanyl-D-glutamate--2,6-diaminopimelate ligase [Saccharopolyspora sp. HNM0983]MBE9374262.1 UDP-N-acetylmuramoyl-L-alanyl-D-glutamate--2,6-diaminopimelate ligase [Saccharopolyspora sp. HNM0983]